MGIGLARRGRPSGPQGNPQAGPGKGLVNMRDPAAIGALESISEQLHLPTDLRNELVRLRSFQLDATRLREPSERVGADNGLALDASNLPTALAELPPPSLGALRADLVSLVPGLSSFDVVPEDESFRIDFEFSGGARLPARVVSCPTGRYVFSRC